jgi:hypothetical protein
VVTRRDLDERITPGEFAQQLAGVGRDRRYRVDDLLTYFSNRPDSPSAA